MLALAHTRDTTPSIIDLHYRVGVIRGIDVGHAVWVSVRTRVLTFYMMVLFLGLRCLRVSSYIKKFRSSGKLKPNEPHI